MFCSSIPGKDISGDSNINDFLKNEIQGNVWVIYHLSSNYYDSTACLNEMGATWVLNQKYSSFLVPDFDFKEIQGAIDPHKVSYHIDKKMNLINLKILLQSSFQ